MPPQPANQKDNGLAEEQPSEGETNRLGLTIGRLSDVPEDPRRARPASYDLALRAERLLSLGRLLRPQHLSFHAEDSVHPRGRVCRFERSYGRLPGGATRPGCAAPTGSGCCAGTHGSVILVLLRLAGALASLILLPELPPPSKPQLSTVIAVLVATARLRRSYPSANGAVTGALTATARRNIDIHSASAMARVSHRCHREQESPKQETGSQNRYATEAVHPPFIAYPIGRLESQPPLLAVPIPASRVFSCSRHSLGVYTPR